MTRRELLLLLGGTVIAPCTLRAQQKPMPMIGLLSGVSPEPTAPYVAAFRQGLGETGWVEGQNLKIEYQWAEFQYTGYPDWPPIWCTIRWT